MKHIHFIVNPIAGSGKHQINLELLQTYFNPTDYTIVLKYSNYKKHAIALTQESIKEQPDVIVACGGDGTINEVACCLVSSPIILGIVPMGSGNGLASNLNIPKNIDKALTLIKTESIKSIDVGKINNQYFFSNFGVGFDAEVIKNYEASKSRKLIAYIKASLKSLKELEYSKEFEISINDKTFNIHPFMVFISNSNELGYNVSLTPKASLQDGLLDVLIISKINKLRILFFGIAMLFKKPQLVKEAQAIQTKNIHIINKHHDVFQTQIDGELHTIKNKTINISLLEKSLNVIA